MDKRKLPHDHGTNTLEVFEEIYGDKSFEEAAAVFSMVSDGTRLKIFCLLCHTEDCVINIAAAVGMSSPAVSHHLRILKQAGLISSRKVGKEVYYTASHKGEGDLLHRTADRIIEIKSERRENYGK